ncbi:helix-turn-helix transcriptional regulator [Salisaeta longa]|uniref:helix-turn-helix transcriptional regulator n=1 Tax=Salisaeta longa TaxID=503170 RepID=UPI0003B73BFA|nr:WYL domain-containing protein [Salisaeta longa]
MLHHFSNDTQQALYELLRDGEALTYREMEDALDRSNRQVRRTVKKLKAAGLPVQTRKRGRANEYYLPSSHQQSAHLTLDLDEHEVLALVITAAAARSNHSPSPLHEPLAAAFDQIMQSLPTGISGFEPRTLIHHIHFGQAPHVSVDADVFLALVRALGNRRRMAIDYHAAYNDTFHEGRVIEPYALARRGDAWLCVARDPNKPAGDDLRDFNLSRISDVRPADPDRPGGQYTIPDAFDLDIYFLPRFESIEGGEDYVVTLLFAPECVPYLQSKRYQRSQQIHDTERPDGRVEVSYEVAGLDEIATFVRSWGPKVEVLKPAALRDKIRDEARAVAAQYETASSAAAPSATP